MRILIIYAYAGVGHKKAGEAIYNVLLQSEGLSVSIIDVLDWTNPIFKFLYPRIYINLIEKLPSLWGLLYYFFDCQILDTVFAPIRRFLHNIQSRLFIGFIIREKPDVVICTHFLPAEVISGLKKKGVFKGRLIAVVTDFLPHNFWLAKESDYFIAGIEKTKAELINRGIKEEKIKVLGIPCDARFSVSKGREILISKLGLVPNIFTVLIMGGGFGTGPVKRIVFGLSNLPQDIKDKLQLVVIAGKNKNLYKVLNKVRDDLNIKLSVWGFMDNINEFMDVSDCIVTKSGGMTISEALVKRLPMIIIQPIPGQETRNCKVLSDFGVGLVARDVQDVKRYIRDLVIYPEKVNQMKERMGEISFPDSANKIAKFVRGL